MCRLRHPTGSLLCFLAHKRNALLVEIQFILLKRFLWKVWATTKHALSVCMVVVLSVPRTILQLRACFIASIIMLSSSKRRAIIASLSKLHLSKKYRRIQYMNDSAAEV